VFHEAEIGDDVLSLIRERRNPERDRQLVQQKCTQDECVQYVERKDTKRFV
jgi:hypothetical protein